MLKRKFSKVFVVKPCISRQHILRFDHRVHTIDNAFLNFRWEFCNRLVIAPTRLKVIE
jgi:hypothetical protein